MAEKLVVGVDLGMTFTGVAYSTQNMARPNVIQFWPGRLGQVENKVPTVLTYTSDVLTSWGFLCQSDDDYDPFKVTRQWFKLLLNPRILEGLGAQPDVPRITVHDVRKWYLDFLQRIYQHVETTMLSKCATTWTRQGMIEDYRAIIEQAGFGSGAPGHQVVIGLTEAEAAAVYTAKGSMNAFSRGHTLLICDAGGGTTDIAVLEVASSPGEPQELTQLDIVNGVDVGSTKIDEKFEEYVTQRLEQLRSYVHFDDDAASKMTRGLFQPIKCAFGPEGDFQTYSIRVPGMPQEYTNEAWRISRGKMGFAKAELQQIFDSQVKRICELIDKQLQRMALKMPEKQISYLVLSGGLGSSSYVQECLRTRYIAARSPPSNARYMEILVSDEPQLSVAKGLVMDRIQKLAAGRSILETRCCRASYGMVCMEIYNGAKHFGLETWTDPLDKRVYVREQIDWFVKKGQPVRTDRPIEHDFTRKIEPHTPRVTWKTRLVSSTVDLEYLPTTFSSYLDPSTVSLLCTLESDLTRVSLTTFKKKNRHWYNSGKPYYRAEYSVKVVIGPADLRFELWMGGAKYSKDRSIKVEWGPAERGANVGVDGREREGVRWEGD